MPPARIQQAIRRAFVMFSMACDFRTKPKDSDGKLKIYHPFLQRGGFLLRLPEGADVESLVRTLGVELVAERKKASCSFPPKILTLLGFIRS